MVWYDAVDYKKARYNILSEQIVRQVRIPVKMNTASGSLCWGTSKVSLTPELDTCKFEISVTMTSLNGSWHMNGERVNLTASILIAKGGFKEK